MSGPMIYQDENSNLVKAWTKGVEFDEKSQAQIKNIASLPFIHRHIAVMPDVHLGKGATVGSVIPTLGAVIPSAVGVDIGCGMTAVRTSLVASDLPDSLTPLRSRMEALIPVGFNAHKEVHSYAEGPLEALIDDGYKLILAKEPKLEHPKMGRQLGTLGGGNHFVEVCIDEEQRVWIMLHSGSRGVGNLIGRHYIAKAKRDMEKYFIHLPDDDLAYLPEGTDNYWDYMHATMWAQEYAKINREIMLANALDALTKTVSKEYSIENSAIDCHHNYVTIENHFGKNVHITRKGAVCARKGQLGIIPGSMGAKSFIVEGLGNADSFNSCSHGAGRVMSRTQAKKLISLEEHLEDTKGVECRKDADLIDESPKAYKDIDAVMEAQKDLVLIKHTLKQVLCIKG